MKQEIRIRINEKEQKEIFTKLIKKFHKDFSKASKYLGISNSLLSRYKRAITKYIPEGVLVKAVNHLRREKPLSLERGTLTEIRRNYIKKSYPILKEKYGTSWTKELVKRRDFKGISLHSLVH